MTKCYICPLSNSFSPLPSSSMLIVGQAFFGLFGLIWWGFFMNTNIKINIYYKIKQNSLILWRWLKYHWQQGGNSLIVLAWVVILYIIREVRESTLEFHLTNLSPGAKHSLPGWSPATGLNLFPAGCKLGRCLILNLQYHMHAADERSTKCHFYGTWEIQVAPRYFLFKQKYFTTVFCTEPKVLKRQLHKTLYLAFTVGCLKGPSIFLLSSLHFSTV